MDEDSDGKEFHGRNFLDPFKPERLAQLRVSGKCAKNSESIMYIVAEVIIQIIRLLEPGFESVEGR